MRALIALTGGIGAGKSLVARFLRDHGAVTIDADEVARDCVLDPDVHASLRTLIPGAFAASGELDRGAMAQAVFADAELRQQVERLMHPWIRSRMRQLAEQAWADGATVVVLEIPLLVESRAAHEIAAEFDGVITVESPESTRLVRLHARGLAESEARARMAAQATTEQRCEIASWVIENDGDQSQLQHQVAEVWQAISHMEVGDRP